jgi:hypothetical protein
LGAKFLVVLCAGFALLLGEDTPTSSCIGRPCLECHEASKHHLLKFGFLLLVQFNLGFTTEGRLATVLIIPSSWVPNGLYLRAIKQFSGAVAGEKENFCKGSLTRIIFTLFCFILFLLALFYQKYKKIVSFIVITLLLLFHYVVP